MKEGDKYRHRGNGNIGFLCKKGDAWKVRYFRGQHSPEEFFDPDVWDAVEGKDLKPLDGQRAVVAYAADQALCRVLGQFGETKMWESLPQSHKRAWGNPRLPPMVPTAERGMDHLEIRQRLYLFVHTALGAEVGNGGD